MSIEQPIAERDNWFVGEDKIFRYFVTTGADIVTRDVALKAATSIPVEPLTEALTSGDLIRFRDSGAGVIATLSANAVIGDITLDEVLSQRERINEAIRVRLDSETNRWGIKVTNVEIKEIDPPREILEAMNRQMSAERVRRAVVLEASGTKEANITVAEGEKQAAILRAEGDKEAQILAAEGDQQAAILIADGFSQAMTRVNNVAEGVHANSMGLQYLDTLKALGDSPSSKFIFPMEFTGLLGRIAGLAGGGNSSDSDD